MPVAGLGSAAYAYDPGRPAGSLGSAERIDSLSITSRYAYDARHPAGAPLTDVVDVIGESPGRGRRAKTPGSPFAWPNCACATRRPPRVRNSFASITAKQMGKSIPRKRLLLRWCRRPARGVLLGPVPPRPRSTQRGRTHHVFKKGAMRWSRNDGQKKDVSAFCYGSKIQRGFAR